MGRQLAGDLGLHTVAAVGVMVMCDGRITGFIDGKDATQENIMALATQFETAPTAAANQ